MTQRRAIALAIGGVVAAGGVAVLLLVLTGGHGGGKAGPQELFQAMIDAAEHGDEPALLAMHISAGAATVMECAARTAGAPDDAGRGRNSSDPDEMKREAIKELDAQLRHWKGLAVTLHLQGERGEPDVMPPSPSDSHHRCKATASMTLHELAVTLEMKDGDRTRTKHATLAAAEIGGGWYFLDLPSPPTTTADLTRLRDRMCRCATDPNPAGCAEQTDPLVDEAMLGMKDADLVAVEREIGDCRRKTPARVF